jgi:hypothetical protein
VGEHFLGEERGLQFQEGEKKPGHWWITPVILAIQKAEIRRIKI